MQTQNLFDQSVIDKIENAKLLVVGAGGIGCELVKTLSLSGFKQMAIIDLDTIDISNLNRQFLFRREHVDKPKSLVLKEQIEKQNPSIKIEAYLGKIQEARFGFHFFSRFDLVINALDNEAARKHVNQICFTLGKPLIDAGTNGYEMTCISILKGETPCYQCIERQKDQTFPVCTIRQRPEKLIHCIVWAKALYEGIYGPKQNASNPDVVDEILADLDKARVDADSSGHHQEFAKLLFNQVFGQEPTKLRETLEEAVKAPEAAEAEKKSNAAFLTLIKPLKFEDYKIEFDEKDEKKETEDEHLTSTVVQPIEKHVTMFAKAIQELHMTRKDQIGQLTFSKDDPLSLQFVSAATNLRAATFSIAMETVFKIKEMAGRIVPAISSSNALAASIQVIEAIKLLTQSKQLKGVFYQRLNPSVRLNSYDRMSDMPNAMCQVCNDDSATILLANIKDQCTLKLLIDQMKADEKLNLSGRTILVEVHGNLIYEYDAENVEMIADGNDMDEDEVQEIKEELAMNEKRIQKTFEHLKILEDETIMIKADVKTIGERVFYVQVAKVDQEAELVLTVLKEGKGNPPPPIMQPAVPEKPAEEEKKASETMNDGQVDISSDECEELDIGTSSVIAAATILNDGLMTPTKLPKKRSADDMAMTDDGTVPTDQVTDNELAGVQGIGSTNKKQKM